MIFMFGDVHGNFQHVESVVDEHAPNAIIFLGDIEAQRPLEQELAAVLDKTEVWWIPGNHDTDIQANYDNLFHSALVDRNLHGRIVEIDGVRVAGLGGWFRPEIWYPDPADALVHFNNYADYEAHWNAQRGGEGAPSEHVIKNLLLQHRSTIFYNEWFALYGQQADILVTHEAPSCHPHGFSVLTDLARSMHVKSAFHGHQHDRLNYVEQHKELEFAAHGVGFCGVTDQYGGMVLAGDFDGHFEEVFRRKYGRNHD